MSNVKITDATGDYLLERLEAGLINPDDLTDRQREQVLKAQENKQKRYIRKGKRTRFGLGSWKYPTDESLETKKRKSKKLRM